MQQFLKFITWRLLVYTAQHVSGVLTPETCWVVHKRQVINLRNCCIRLVCWFIWNVWWCTDLQKVTLIFTHHIRVFKIPIISLLSPPIYLEVIQSYFLSVLSILTPYYSNTYFCNTIPRSLYPISRLSKLVFHSYHTIFRSLNAML